MSEDGKVPFELVHLDPVEDLGFIGVGLWPKD
jgi:hypothetical protein